MTDYEERYEVNGEYLGNYGSPRGNNHSGAEDYSHSKSQVNGEYLGNYGSPRGNHHSSAEDYSHSKSQGAPVKVRRPSNYNPSLAATLGPSQPNPNLNLGAVELTPGSAGGLEGPDCIFVGGLPYDFTEAQIRVLFEAFGPLQGFDLVKDRETGNSKGYALRVYQGTTQPKPEQENVLLHAQQQIALQRLMLQPPILATKVLFLTHMVNVDELKDDEDYEDIGEDMRTEC